MLLRYALNTFLVANFGQRCRRAWLTGLIALFSFFAPQTVFSSVVTAPPVTIIPDHSYVYYSPDCLPAPTGTIEDVTSGLVLDDHKYDIYGNELIVDTATDLIHDLHGEVVGFVATAN